MFRRGAMRMPGIPPHDPYLEASRRYAAAGLPSPYSRKSFGSSFFRSSMLFYAFLYKFAVEEACYNFYSSKLTDGMGEGMEGAA
jgi:hypothetical protein